MKEPNYKVYVSCLTYNHSVFIKQAMDGFCMQQTSFPFVCGIVDDCSTDGEQDVINKYLLTNFNLSDPSTRKEETENYHLIFSRHKKNQNCFFAVLFLKYNHFQKKPKTPYLKKWTSNVNYHAWCEGDDYWTDPLKLQKQVEFLESHPDYTMACNRTQLYSEKKQQVIGENFCYNQSQTVSVKDAIWKGGLFISTCSIVYRTHIKENYPDYCLKCRINDYPLQIMAAMKGKVFYFNEPMSTYRIQNENSWMGKLKWTPENYDTRIAILRSIINMFNGFAKDYPQYAGLFKNKIAYQISGSIPNRKKKAEIRKKYYNEFKNEIKGFPLLWKLDAWIGFSIFPLLVRIRKLYYSPFEHNIKRYK